MAADGCEDCTVVGPAGATCTGGTGAGFAVVTGVVSNGGAGFAEGGEAGVVVGSAAVLSATDFTTGEGRMVMIGCESTRPSFPASTDGGESSSERLE